jgi:hypothetical protein
MALIDIRDDRGPPTDVSAIPSLVSIPKVDAAAHKKRPVMISDCSGVVVLQGNNLK